MAEEPNGRIIAERRASVMEANIQQTMEDVREIKKDIKILTDIRMKQVDILTRLRLVERITYGLVGSAILFLLNSIFEIVKFGAP